MHRIESFRVGVSVLVFAIVFIQLKIVGQKRRCSPKAGSKGDLL